MERGAAEVWALEQALARSPRQTLDELIAQLYTEARGEEAKIAAARGIVPQDLGQVSPQELPAKIGSLTTRLLTTLDTVTTSPPNNVDANRDGKISGPEMVQALLVWLGQNSGTIESEFLPHVRQYFQRLQNDPRVTSIVPTTVADVSTHVSGFVQHDTQAWKTAAHQAQQADQAKTKLDDAVAVISAQQEAVLAKVRDMGSSVTPTAVYVLLRTHLQELQPQNTHVQRAREVLATRAAPLDPFTVSRLPRDKQPDAKDVMDDLIAVLRHQHVLAIRESGHTTRSKRIEDALKAAYEHRSGMVFIRPSSAFLRSSYPSTSLQDNPGLQWQNMLGRHAARNTPFLGELIANPERERTRIIAEIDKQFWQNINRVRVAGAGHTNYVIAKDDIGNWYVKRYSADPEDIIKSAQKLAMFNLGAHLEVNLLNRLKQESGKQGIQQQTDAGQSSLGRLFQKHTEVYTNRSGEDYQRVLALLANKDLETRIKQAWN